MSFRFRPRIVVVVVVVVVVGVVGVVGVVVVAHKSVLGSTWYLFHTISSSTSEMPISISIYLARCLLLLLYL